MRTFEGSLRSSATPARIWLVGALAAVGAGAIMAGAPLLLLGFVGLAVGAAAFALAFTQPRWVLLAQLAILVSYAIDLVRQRYSVPLTTESLVLLLLVGVAFRRVLRIEHVEVPPRESALLVAVLLAMAASTVFAADRTQSVEVIVEFLKNAVVVILMLALLDQPEWLRRAVWAVASAVGGLGLLAIAHRLVGFDFWGFASVESDRGLERSGGPLDPNYFGQICVVGGILALYLFLVYREPRSRLRLAALALALSSFLAVGLTFSRGALISLAVALGAAAVLRRVRPWLPLGAAAATALVAALALPQENKDYLAALVTPVRSGAAAAEDESVRDRVGENIVAVRMLADHPTLGVGPGNYTVRYLEYSPEVGLDLSDTAKAAHNLYLESLAETGILGALALAAVLATALAGAWSARSRLSGAAALVAEGIFVALLGFLVTSFFLHGSAFPRYLWIIVGLALAARRLAQEPRPAA